MAKVKIKQIEKEYKTAILSFSGGILSSTYLLQLLNNEYYNKIYAVFFDYDKQYPIEKQSANEVIKFLEQYDSKNKLEYNQVTIRINDKITDSLSKIKDYDSVSEKEIFLNLDAILSLAETIVNKGDNTKIDIHLGINSDFTEELVDDYQIGLESVVSRFTDKITLYKDYEMFNKQDAVKDGYMLANIFQFDGDDFFKRTYTVARTIKIGNRLFADITDPKAGGRVLAFYLNNRIDPIKYANNDEILTWDETCAFFGVFTSKDEFGNDVISEIPESKVLETVKKSKDSVFVPEPPHQQARYANVVETF